MSRKPTIHEPPADDFEPGFEYSFPVGYDDLDPAHSRLLSDWFHRFLDHEPASVAAILEDDWGETNSPAFSEFAGYLAQLSPTSIVFWDDRVWIYLKEPGSEYGGLMIHEPRELTEEQSAFIDSFDTPELSDFCRHFHDTYEYLSPYNGGLWMKAKPISNDARGDLVEWKEGMYLYHISDGDAIFLSRSGTVGRWDHELAWDPTSATLPVAITKIADSFADFIRMYVENQTSGSHDEIFA